MCTSTACQIMHVVRMILEGHRIPAANGWKLTPEGDWYRYRGLPQGIFFGLLPHQPRGGFTHCRLVPKTLRCSSLLSPTMHGLLLHPHSSSPFSLHSLCSSPSSPCLSTSSSCTTPFPPVSPIWLVLLSFSCVTSFSQSARTLTACGGSQWPSQARQRN